MKCPKCGTNLTIDDAVCPSCGAQNPFAKKHRAEMRRYRKKFSETQKEVLQKSRFINSTMVKITCIAVLVLISFLCIFIRHNVYDIKTSMQVMEVKSHLSRYRDRLNEMEENRDFNQFAQYYMEHELYACGELEEYDAVYSVCSSCSFIFYDVLEIMSQESPGSAGDPDSGWHGYSSFDEYAEQKIESFSYELEQMYQDSRCGEHNYYDRACYSPAHQSCMDDCVSYMEELLQICFHLTDEELAGLAEMSKAGRTLLLEEGVKRDE